MFGKMKGFAGAHLASRSRQDAKKVDEQALQESQNKLVFKSAKGSVVFEGSGNKLSITVKDNGDMAIFELGDADLKSLQSWIAAR